MSAKTAIALLRAHLDQSKSRGVTHVALTDDGCDSLERLLKNPPGRRPTSKPQRVFEEPKPLPPPVEFKRPAPVVPAGIIEVPGDSLDEKIANLTARAEADPVPKSLGTLRDIMVFSVGSLTARLMFIGEAPGAEEERQREPFVGPAGQKLTQIIEKAMGIPRSEVYISNICKFRPSTGPGQGTNNRQPTPDEMASCIAYMTTEIALIRPEIIVALGATASQGLGIEGPVGRLRGRFHEFQGIPVMVTYHPSYLIRREQEGMAAGVEAKRAVWEDMLKVMEKLGMPVSEKQRGYFLPKAG